MKKTCFIAVLAASFVCAPAFGTPQLWLKAGIDPTMPMGRNGDTLDSMLTAQAANASAAAAAQTTASAAIPKSGNMDASGNLIAPVVNKTVTIKDPLHSSFGGVQFQYPSQNGSAYGNPYELRVLANAPLNNPLRLENDYPTGLAAWSYAGWDSALKSVHEHMAIGYGAGLKNGAWKDYNYIETGCYQTNSDGSAVASPTCPATDLLIQQTGAEYSQPPAEEYALFTDGSTDVTLKNGGIWPDGINGQVITTPVSYGMVPQGTTIVNGAGTSTITLSNPANATSGEAAGTVTWFGPTEYSQHDSIVFKGMGNLDFYSYVCAKWGNYACGPFASFDFNHSRMGINNPHPQFPLDVVGAIVANISSTATDPNFAGSGAINAQVDPGTPRNNVWHAYGVGVNQFNVFWNLNPSRLDFVDSNGSATPFSIYMDGSWQTRQPAHPVSSTDAARTLAVADCGTTITLTGSTAEAVMLPSGLPTGCRITVTQLGTGTVTVVPDSSEALHWFDTAAETGTYTVAGQYASAVIEAKTAAVATVERGQ
ncbi:hypothetical protein [Gluconobacter sp.]|uniref:hypothetical protein n=1 Tax=Gluconobacter sp. TaxID=1876758 RepID=UPI0039E8DC9A